MHQMMGIISYGHTTCVLLCSMSSDCCNLYTYETADASVMHCVTAGVFRHKYNPSYAITPSLYYKVSEHKDKQKATRKTI